MKFNDFSGLYPVSKTLRFEAKPIGATLENIIKSGILDNDRHRAESYKKVKKLIDEYHKKFIDKVMCEFSFPDDLLEEYKNYYFNKKDSEKSKEHFNELQGEMRKQIYNAIKQNEAFKRIDKKELIREDLDEFIRNAEEDQLSGLSKDEANELVLEF